MKPIMIQGTMSSVGKSLLTAGLCRLFHQDGYRVAPFKSQNMALNSFVTREGLEMGRAQVMQAEAAGTEPSVLMNPILLKPSSDTGSQVIVNGEVVGNMKGVDYFAWRKKLRPVIVEAYQKLAAQNDIIVIEGAGSPAEINLNQDDIVNMGLAEMTDAPVLLVGDIDRGGVFASLFGTLALLKSNERQRVKGVIINKFRGDMDLLRPGLEMLRELIHVPVIGVVPWLKLDLDDEDSLADRLNINDQSSPIRIAVIRLPHLANFTDFNGLSRFADVGLHYVQTADELTASDLIILPGTKNTLADLLWLRQAGLEAAIKWCFSAGTPVIGICGGYQMMGMTLADPEGIERGGSLRGLELLPVDTVFTAQKARTRVDGVVQPLTGVLAPLGGSVFSGYEIHMGRTSLRADAHPFAILSDGLAEGAVDGHACGSYVHGLLDDALGQAVVRMLRQRKGLPDDDGILLSADQFKQQQYDFLAETLRQNLDVQQIYAILGIH
jgi:adenosylcobyric acid synthase